MAVVISDVGGAAPLFVMGVAAVVGSILARLKRKGESRPPVAPRVGGEPDVRGPAGEAPDSRPGSSGGRSEDPPGPPYLGLILRRAAELNERYEYAAASRRALLHDPLFTAAVDEIHAAHVASDVTVLELVRLAGDNRLWVHRLAAAVLGRCDDVPETWVRGVTRRIPDAAWDYAGLLAFSVARSEGRILAPILAVGNGLLADDVVDLIDARVRGGYETLTEDDLAEHLGPANRDWLATFVDERGQELPEDVRAAIGAWLGAQVDLGPEVSGLVTVWRRPFVREPVFLNASRTSLADEIVELVTQEQGKSVILVGEPGVGKTELVRAAFDPLPWTVFEAQSSQLNAGAMYVGQLEGRVDELARRLEAERAIWVFPNFQSALFTGAHSNNPTGLIERLLPYVERGAVRIVAETTPAGYASLVARLPVIAGAFTVLRVEELDEHETVQLCTDVLESRTIAAAPSTLHEVHGLAQQFLPGQAAPGSTLRLLRATVDLVEEEGRADVALGDVFSSLSLLSGLPLSILDPSAPLGLDRVKAFFEDRVLGQPDAVEVVVDRIALVKAGLTDPTRPLGVFLFVGPTGTGKTELAKAVAELVFGSPDRLVRLDMSEYQTPDSLDRLLADADLEPTAAPLIAAVRRRPFSVVLLDEFEKAAPPIRDLFLQLFDDGRLTDRTGRTTDFRRCLIVMTSNVGSALQAGPGVGFSGQVEPFREADVERALRGAFRPEFLNRIDRVVVFRPFDRVQMRLLLEKELDDVVRRRGMRDRPWAIEVDESAIEFLIEKGFTPDLGARPLKRAVEAYVLTPLARAIADGQIPTGDQFLFLTADGGRIEARFVGLETERKPDEGETADVEDDVAGALLADVDVREIARSGTRSPDAQRHLRRLADGVAARVDGMPAVRKQLLLGELRGEGFWERDDRFAVMAEVEYLDRLEEATRTAGHLADRLLRARDPAVAEEVAGLLANRLLVLEAALGGLEDEEAPFEVALRLSPAARAPGEGDLEADAFLEQLVAMYRGWAGRCGMTIVPLPAEESSSLMLVSGLGAGAILGGEAGLHVAEHVEPGDDGATTDRVGVAVEVAGVPPGEPVDRATFLVRVLQALDAAPAAQRVTRRYRFEPDTLVRDAVRNYRTGRLDRVLAGEFDLY